MSSKLKAYLLNKEPRPPKNDYSKFFDNYLKSDLNIQRGSLTHAKDKYLMRVKYMNYCEKINSIGLSHLEAEILKFKKPL